MYSSGLVLEGGGNRSIYTSGVLDAFIEKEIEFPYVIGVSAGSCNATSYIAKDYRRQHDIIVNYSNDKHYMGLGNILKGHSFLNTDWIFGELAYDISPLNQDEFDKSNTVLCAVATNGLTGKPEYFYPKSMRNGCDELKASCSLPGVTNGVEIGGTTFFDGGLVDSIPLERAFDDGCKKAVVILTQCKGYAKSPMNPKVKKIFKKFPKIGEAAVNRHIMYNTQLEFVKQCEENGTALVIQPAAPLNVSTLEKDVSKLESIYQLGYKQGLDRADEIKAFLND
ncbi:patatin family protein [uncultured Eubacterium sp.]|uniref:patatin-like phospholipase family protein n=1 Tax=uncultured Eubacterium sp. TaxID=165185 RepID=UPI0025E636BA|nr:patatin family protein [uncultured Eubacterium sp.]